MGDAFITEVNEAVDYLRRCHSPSGNDLKRLKDVKSLNEMSQMIRAKLNESEEMEITCESAGLRLKALKKIFYDVEDVLDEFLYHVLHLKSEGATFPVDDNLVKADVSILDQKRNLSPSNNPHGNLVLLDELAQKATDLKVKLDKQKIDWDGNVLGLAKIHQQKPTTVRPQSTSLMGSSRMIGRGHDLETIKGLLFSELHGDGNIPVIAIVGMGGLGKTTLAQFVYNDTQVQQHFNLKIWVCVSEEFDLERLTRAMLESLEEKKCDLTQLDPLQRRLKGIVERKRLLLVFDDVWEHQNLNIDAWEQLYKPFLGVSDGSKILVTTRSKSFLDRVIRADSVHRLPYLTDNDCFMLFSQHAFEDLNSDIDPTLLDIGKKISNNCRGLPLAAKTLGSLLRGQDDVEEWNDILNNSGIWPTDDQSSIMPILRLSYQHLSINLKKCFRYCSLFPKDYQFQKKELINMWMAHGYISRTERRKKQLEDIGEEYINELVSRSLFEQDVSRDEWWSVEDGVFYGNKDDTVQHFSVISTMNYPREHVQCSPQIQCLLFFNSMLSWPDVKDLCSRMKQLRVLNMSYTGILILPECIGDLKHLRFLSVQGNKITELPETFGSLYLLETLNLNYTKIEVLPDSICLLKRLHYLGLRGTWIEYLPESLGMLDQHYTLDVEFCKIYSLPDSISNLPSLRRLICNDGIEFSLAIGKLTELRGRHFIVKEFTDLVDVDEAKKVSWDSREHLQVLSLHWKEKKSPMAHRIHGKVLESLGPYPNLRQLYMRGFEGDSLPSWIRDPRYFCALNRIELIRCEYMFSELPQNGVDVGERPSPLRTLAIVDCPNVSFLSEVNFNALRVLKIIGCHQLEISHLSGLASLQHLSIINFHQDIGKDFSCGGFLLLERLYLEDLPNWCSWEGPQEGECPKLQELSVVDCHSLSYFSISCLHSLKDISVKNCPRFRLKLSRSNIEKLLRMNKFCVRNIFETEVTSHGYNDLYDIVLWSEKLLYSHLLAIIRGIKL
ncbi:unnamed protein product [Spirodela intermedia]|uniref:Uncharacterized protein n=1 Tax=Spirodela intermedia TaxID=51605 RepID=A0A7I8JZ96_SPIIN|nr:unnamed protein product [Spirodela intermedia]